MLDNSAARRPLAKTGSGRDFFHRAEPGTTSIILPASNEARYIGPCLEALLASTGIGDAHPMEIIVVANACRDETVSIARGFAPVAAARGWRLVVLDLAEGGKLNALNAGDQAARGAIRVYLDADVIVSPALLAELRAALDRRGPAYASGAMRIAPSRSRVSRAYGRLWARVPFMAEGVPGCGVFAVNAAGRARWGAFPDIISDDTFARLQFTPEERIAVAAPYDWPIVEGFSRLVRVRRRQDAGVAEIARRYPALLENEGKAPVGASGGLRLALSDPIGFAVYAAVALAVRLPLGGAGGWSRGR
ncbi:glycosyltransferase family 2 protein [uncultured Amaricoccus sp.]|uniref:glycosyltransferase family 2 protein n=1 Tax=uncultured Amaricoccus sp. TaxID=339341 RepID=UPI0026212545|nr:glycosyltransferase family 2 protein [uncultured Amaricoccus sp.]